MMEKMGRKDVDRFLRHMWLSKCGDLKARGLFHEIKHHIDAKKIKSIDFADMCLIECTSYLSIIEPDQDKLEQAYPHVSGLVRYLQIAPALPLLLSGIRTLKPTNFTKLAQMAASIALRHAVVANLNPSDLESAFYKSARMLRELKEGGATDAKALREVRNELARLNPPDTTVIPAFASLEVSKPQAQYILSIIAKSIQSKTKEITLEAPTLEHIYPEHPGPDWAQSDLKESDVWQIGNLTLLGKGPNEKAGNFAFPVKCNMPPPKSR
jgi:hypothetical protein